MLTVYSLPQDENFYKDKHRVCRDVQRHSFFFFTYSTSILTFFDYGASAAKLCIVKLIDHGAFPANSI